MPEPTPSPVLVVGTGPVGLTAALALHVQGVPVRIVGRDAGCSTLSKALVVWSRTIEDLAGVIDPQRLLAAGVEMHGMSMHHGGRDLASLKFADLPACSRFPAGILIPQFETEKLLVDQLRECGIEVEWETELVSFTQDDAAVEARLRHPDGSETTCTTPWLVAADGAHSTVRHQLEVPFTGHALSTSFWIADVRLDVEPPEGEGATYFHEHGVCMVLPIGSTDHLRIIATAPVEEDGDPTLEQIQDVLDRSLPMKITASDPRWLAHFAIRERVVESLRHGRILLAGDAAHTHSPAGGHGMNTGMQDVFNLAWKIALHQRGVGGEALLDSYSDERHQVARKVITDSGRLTKLMSIDSPALSFLRNSGLRIAGRFGKVLDQMSRNLQMMDLDYRESGLPRVSSIPRNHGSIDPGTRLPLLDATSAEGRSTTLDAEHSSDRFTLFVIESERTPSFEKAVRAMQAAIDGLDPSLEGRVELIAVRVAGGASLDGVTLLHDVDGGVARAAGFRGHGAMLVRPDRIATLFCGALDGGELHRWFHGL
ncbi:MAG: FAD-dependent monooxygenase [Planctomycetota bacterium]|nr:FAD-dependent monooxygenase [Planctomycetota bacterium]